MIKTADKPQVLLEHHLKALKLPTFLAEYERQARECATAGIDHTRYLLRLAELEALGAGVGAGDGEGAGEGTEAVSRRTESPATGRSPS